MKSAHLIPIVMVDTNILIEGPKRQEHHTLKELATQGRIKLFICSETKTEKWGVEARKR